jgi:di/tricarboxylate transporter
MNALALMPLLAAVAPLTLHGWIALLVTAGVFLVLQLHRSVPVDALFVGALMVVTLTGVVSPTEAIAGFASQAVVLIGALLIASEGLRATGALDWIGNTLLGSARTERGALTRLALVVVPVCAFVLNTPVVAMMAPVVVDWCRKRRISPSRLLLPLSYLAVLGGVCTLIGTTTTLVSNGTLAAEARSGAYSPEMAAAVGEMSFGEISWIGVPVAVVGAAYILLVAPRLLPDRTDLIEQLGEQRREYLVEMLVQPTCSLIGKTVEAAGLRQLPGLFLIEIDRGEETITPVTPQDAIQAGDRMIFTGVVTTIADLERIPGLVPAVDMTYEFHPAERTRRRLTETVLSRTSPLIGRTVREVNFRQLYNAAVVAVHRNGERLTNKIGNIRLEPGDTLLLQTRTDFVEAQRHNRDFYLVSEVGGSSARRHDRALLAVGLFAGLIAWLVVSSLISDGWRADHPLVGWMMHDDIKPIAGLAVVIMMIATRCLTASDARSAIDLQVLFTVAAAIGVGNAMHHSGAATWLAGWLVHAATSFGVSPDWKPYVLLTVVYLTTIALTETISNVAVVAIMIPVAISLAMAGDCHPRPYIIGVTLAASLSFVTPIGYQCNLMVMGPGGYHPRDYLRVGGPLAVLVSLVALGLIPVIWPFHLPLGP